jgi:hypothetical protein
MKYIIVSDFVYPRYTGGSARYAYNLVKGMVNGGKNEVVLVSRKPFGTYQLQDEDLLYNNLCIQEKAYEVSLSFWELRKVLARIDRKDLINVHHPVLGSVISFLRPFNEMVYFFHGPYHEEYYQATGKRGAGYLMRYILQKLILMRADKIR